MAFPKLFIPRKNYMTGKLGDAQLNVDELANYLAIENWANSLVAPAGGLRFSTITVGAHDAADKTAAHYDFFATGTADDVVLNRAFTAARAGGNGAGEVVLSDGNFNLSNVGAGVSALNGNNVFLRGMGGGLNTVAATVINTGNVGANSIVLSGCVEVSNLQITSFNNTFGTGATIINGNTIVFKVTASVVGMTGGSGLIAYNVLFVDKSATTGGTPDQTFVSWNPKLSTGNQAWATDNSFASDIGVDLTVGGGTGQSIIVARNWFNGTEAGAIKFPASSNYRNSLMIDNLMQDCGNATHDVVTLGGTHNTYRGNIHRRVSAAQPQNGITILASGSGTIVVENDQRDITPTGAKINNLGAGTLFNYDGSAANWNL